MEIIIINNNNYCYVLDHVREVNAGKEHGLGNSLVVQWLGLSTFTAGGLGSIPSWGTKIPSKNRKKKKKKNMGFEGYKNQVQTPFGSCVTLDKLIIRHTSVSSSVK